MNRKLLIGGAVAAIVLIAGLYFVSPFIAVYGFSRAIKSGDRDQIASAVDFPSLRESLKGELNAMMMKKMSNDQSFKGNPFSGLASALVPMMVDKAVEGYITPDGLATLVRNKSDAPSGQAPQFNGAYINLDHFKVTPKGQDTDPTSFVFERNGFAKWRLTRINLPEKAFD